MHEQLGTAAMLPQYVWALHALGIVRNDSYVTNGHTEYVGRAGSNITASPVHATYPIADTSDPASLHHHLRLHEQGQTSYKEMS